MRTKQVNLPTEGSKRSDAVTGSPIGPEPIVEELASATVRATSPKAVGWLRKTLNFPSERGDIDHPGETVFRQVR